MSQAGIVRLTGRELADQRRSRLSRGHCHIDRSIAQLGQFGFKFGPPCSRVARRGIARLNRTSKLAGRENVCEAADNAERPRSLGPARAAARREGPRTGANRIGSSNPDRKLFYIKGLVAVRGASIEPVSRAWATNSLGIRNKEFGSGSSKPGPAKP